MFSNKYVCGNRAEQLESFNYNSPKQDRGRSRRLPYKLLSFPSSKCNLWDHTSVGDAKLLHLFYQRHLRVNIEKAVLRSGHIYISPESRNATQMSCTLCGRLLITESENQVTIIFTKLKFNEEITKPLTHQPTPAEYQVPVTFLAQKTQASNFHQDFKEQAVLWLQNSIRKKDPVVLNNFIRCKAQCQFENHSSSITCNIQFCLATLDAKFILKPISPLTIILTALSKALSDPKGNVFLHGESKSGYVTMEEARRVLLVLDSDPKVTTLPIIGIWISGVETVQHPFLWASCIRYLHMGSFGQQMCAPPEPFLVVVYDKTTFEPQFYDCNLDSPSSKDGFVIYSGSCDSVLDQADVGKLFEVKETQSNNDQLSFNLELMDESTNGSRKTSTSPCLESTRRKNRSLEGSSRLDKDLSPARVVAVGHLHDNCCKCSCKSRDSYVEPVAGTSTTNSPKLANTPRQEQQCMEISLPDSPIPNQNLYGLLLAQDQQLKQLKERLDSLLLEKDAATLSASSSPKNDVDQLASNNKTIPKTVNCAATMTSLAWPPQPLVNDSPKAIQVALPPEELPSPEIERKQALNNGEFQSTLMTSMMNGLANLQLPNFEESMESVQSAIVVDLHDYPESNASFSRDTDCSEFNSVHCNAPSRERCSFAKSRNQQEPTNWSETEDESTFYGNLLRKIQNILSHQESSDGNATGSNTVDYTDGTPTRLALSNERSCFDSLLIPHLNYVSMMPTDISSDQSLEFCTLALKYLNKCSTKLPPSGSGRMFDRNNMSSLLTMCRENNLSFASRQYLDKHGLNSTGNEREIPKSD